MAAELRRQGLLAQALAAPPAGIFRAARQRYEKALSSGGDDDPVQPHTLRSVLAAWQQRGVEKGEATLAGQSAASKRGAEKRAAAEVPAGGGGGLTGSDLEAAWATT